ncbi:maternal effect embryo arrest [Parasponia andersonii]|uniref:Maternal effect embryo arrest n=1 Tax=Parasponia andersonii TaxID=3476 RepID=A0A2P5C7H4_PARAD|nr:maternal effect embryo arrest [Parasponia andersonii]
MIKSSLLRSCSSPLVLEAKDLHRSTPSSATRFASTVTCSSRSHTYIPKLEPFSRTRFDRVVKDPPLIEKSENELADYCSTLEGDESYSCWRAYFELKDLEKETSKAEVEKLILQAGGVKSLIGFLHGIAEIHKGNKKRSSLTRPFESEKGHSLSPIPDGLPKSQAELEEEERGKMPDSPYTRLLRTKGKFPAWYSPAPDHETD